jgi:hypothetical protein
MSVVSYKNVFIYFGAGYGVPRERLDIWCLNYDVSFVLGIE